MIFYVFFAFFCLRNVSSANIIWWLVFAALFWRMHSEKNIVTPQIWLGKCKKKLLWWWVLHFGCVKISPATRWAQLALMICVASALRGASNFHFYFSSSLSICICFHLFFYLNVVTDEGWYHKHVSKKWLACLCIVIYVSIWNKIIYKVWKDRIWIDLKPHVIECVCVCVCLCLQFYECVFFYENK